jgi:hypothetical protein
MSCGLTVFGHLPFPDAASAGARGYAAADGCSVATGQAIGHQKRSLSRENVVVLTTLVHLSGQLSNLRLELRRLLESQPSI